MASLLYGTISTEWRRKQKLFEVSELSNLLIGHGHAKGLSE